MIHCEYNGRQRELFKICDGEGNNPRKPTAKLLVTRPRADKAKVKTNVSVTLQKSKQIMSIREIAA